MKTLVRYSAYNSSMRVRMGFATASAPALATINDGPGGGNPATNGSGKCSPGQNKDTSTGGLKKC
jgi:hypothetical protein